MKFFFFSVLLLRTVLLCAQGNIKNIEYWLDYDPGFGAGTKVVGHAPGANVEHSFVVPVSADILPGLHTLGLRSQDDKNRWSHTNIFPAFVFPTPSNAKIDRIEYWIDNDPGINLALPINDYNSDVEVNFAFTLQHNLSVGPHLVGFRSRNTDGKWSSVSFLPIYVSNDIAGVLTDLEYYWKEDPGVGAATAFNVPATKEFEGSFGAIVPLNFTIGTHLLCVRSKATRGNSSLTNCIQVRVDSIVNAEDLTLQTTIQVRPNPFVEEITIVPSDGEEWHIVIYDQSGRLMGNVMAKGETTLNMAGLNPGTYSAFFWRGHTIYKMRLIKI